EVGASPSSDHPTDTVPLQRRTPGLCGAGEEVPSGGRGRGSSVGHSVWPLCHAKSHGLRRRDRPSSSAERSEWDGKQRIHPVFG
ncbi:hypothetical protein AALO_G00034090, partial [Alosa alosa]